MNNQQLINEYLKSRNISENSKTTYYNNFYRLLNFLKIHNKYILDVDINIIINHLNKLHRRARIPLLLILKLLYIYKHKNINIVDRELKNNKIYMNNQKSLINKNLINNSIKFNDLISILKKTKNNNHYIIFYLLINFNVRNMDLIIKKIDDEAQIKQNENYLYFKNGSLIYHRGNYKTLKKYGIKKQIIKNEKFINIIKSIDNNNYILLNSLNKPYTNNTIQKYIISIGNLYFKNSNLNQSLIYKIILDHYTQKKDLLRLEKIADNRGHNHETQKVYYSTRTRQDLNNLQDIFI